MSTGATCQRAEASVNIEDRGYQLADGIYEVVYLSNGRMVDEALHLDRMDRSLREIRVRPPMARRPLQHVLREVARRNRVRDGLLYIQVTRGVAPREHAFPAHPVPPSIVVSVRRLPAFPADASANTGDGDHLSRRALGALRHQDDRAAAQRAGAPGGEGAGRDRGDPDRRGRDGDGGRRDQRVGRGRGWRAADTRAQPCDPARLHPRGPYRPDAGGRASRLRSEPSARPDCDQAKEVFLTSASSFVKGITRIDGVNVGDGRVGPVTRRLFDLFAGMRAEACGTRPDAVRALACSPDRGDDVTEADARFPPTILLWDWDNTLVDAWAGIAAAVNAAFAAFGMPRWTVEETKQRARISMRESFPVIFGSEWKRARQVFHDAMTEQHLDHVRPMPGALEALLAGGRWPQGIVSNKSTRYLGAEVAHLGWAGYFGAVVGAGEARADKPDPAPILLALERLGADATPSVWYLGDTASDMVAARAARVTGVLIGDASHDGGIAARGPGSAFPVGPRSGGTVFGCLLRGLRLLEYRIRRECKPRRLARPSNQGRHHE